jgi:hypothetical protein
MYVPSPEARRRASRRSVSAGTPVVDCTRSGHHDATLRRSDSNPVVRSAT